MVLAAGLLLGPRLAGLRDARSPAVSNLPPRPALPPPDEAAPRLKVPPGFAIRIFAENLFAGKPILGFGSTGPRFMAFGPDGALYVSMTAGGRIVRLADGNGDGLADSVEVVLDDLFLPHGLERHGGWLYVAEGDRVERFKFDPDGRASERELVTQDIPRPDYHVTRTLHFGPDGKLYVSVGANCNVCEPEDPRYGAILRFEADGSIPEDKPLCPGPGPQTAGGLGFWAAQQCGFLLDWGWPALGNPQRGGPPGGRASARGGLGRSPGRPKPRLALLLYARAGPQPVG